MAITLRTNCAFLVYDIDKAQPSPLAPPVFFYCPNIVKTDYYGNVCYDAEWVPNDENFGTTVPYWYALMEPVHGRNNKPEDYKKDLHNPDNHDGVITHLEPDILEC